MKRCTWCFSLLLGAFSLPAQQGQHIFLDAAAPMPAARPVDDIVDRQEFTHSPMLDYPSIREADILWEKRIWREIDTREKMNLVFRGPEPLFEILRKAVMEGRLTAYATDDDKFSTPLSVQGVESLLTSSDTIEVVDPETYEITYRVVKNDFNPDDIIKYRLKEVWFFDSKYSALRVRILGMAPIRYVFDESGNLLYEQPLFWIYYPEARPELAKYRVFNAGNDRSPMSWEDHLEMRFFASYITKENEVGGRRLQDYLSGRDLLLESDKIKNEIFNFEQDLWSY